MLAFPAPYIATTAGWMTAELGRQPWLVYGVMRTADGTSPTVSAGNVAFSTLGYMGLYFVLGVMFLGLVGKLLARGPVQLAGRARLMGAAWFAILAVMLTVYAVLDGFDFGAGITAPLRCAHRRRAEAGVRRARARVGRQRSVARCGRWGVRVRVPAGLRGGVQRTLPAADDGTLATDPARRFDQGPLSARRATLERGMGRRLRGRVGVDGDRPRGGTRQRRPRGPAGRDRVLRGRPVLVLGLPRRRDRRGIRRSSASSRLRRWARTGEHISRSRRRV